MGTVCAWVSRDQGDAKGFGGGKMKIIRLLLVLITVVLLD